MRPPGERFNALLSGRVRPVAGTVTGTVAVLVIGVIFGALRQDSYRATEALALVIPVLAAAVLGGQRAAYIVGVVATATFTFIIPPFGTPRIEFTQDLVALIVFLVVALVVGAVVARRVETLGHLEQQREQLLRSVSHDFRTPLSIICAATSDLMQSPDYDEPTRQRLQTLVLDEAERLDRLVANLLNLSRMRSDGLRPNLQAVDLGELVAHATDRLRRIFHDVELVVNVPAGLPLLQADYTQLDQLLTNLLENAVRHSPPGGVVSLAVLQRSEVVEIKVTDQGPGVAPEHAQLIFEPFWSGSVPGTSGVGLAICSAIVEAHHGTIRVAEPSGGGGAEMIVDLPY